MQQLAAIPIQTLLRELHPKQFGVYDVELARDAELTYFNQISRSMDFHVWSVEVVEARLTLDAVTSSILASDLEDVPVALLARVNREVDIRATCMVGAQEIATLRPVLP